MLCLCELFDGGSQGGYIVFLSDDNDNCCPIEWKSNKVRRVVRSTLAAETLACADSTESVICLADMITEMLGLNSPILLLTVRAFMTMYTVEKLRMTNSYELR